MYLKCYTEIHIELEKTQSSKINATDLHITLQLKKGSTIDNELQCLVKWTMLLHTVLFIMLSFWIFIDHITGCTKDFKA